MLTCSHTLSSTSISRHLYIESSLVFCFLVVCQIWSFLVFSFPLLALSEMYCPQGASLLYYGFAGPGIVYSSDAPCGHHGGGLAGIMGLGRYLVRMDWRPPRRQSAPICQLATSSSQVR